uniref:Uncharacterized protein n=1 Tax=Globisporangium ultimum (strain ATCC 200006 / CBS 805.95 / DAOM BR144) TaxID=431595 RepID=K3WL26_GLOUD
MTFAEGYCNFVAQGRKVTKEQITEMYTYSMAVANRGIKHTIFSHLAITHPYLADTKHWSFVDATSRNPYQGSAKLLVPKEPP